MEEPNNISEEVEKDITIDEEHPHSDKVMLIHVGIKFLLLFIIIFSFDFWIDLIFMILDLIIEIIHLLIEIVDELLESWLREALPTSHHQNEVIIVNVTIAIVVSIVLFSIYKLFHGIRYIYRLKRHLKADWLSYKKRKSLSWHLLPIVSKIKLVTAYCVGFSLLFLLSF